MFEDLASAIGIPFETLFSPGHPFYWLYLVTAAIFAIAICVRRSSERGLSALTGATRQIFDSKIYFHHSAITDYGLVYFNHIFQAMGLGLAFVSAETIAQWGASRLTHLVGSSPRLEAGWSVGLAATLTTAVLGDFAVFYFHLLQHRIPFLWELHKVHHSAEVLTPLTGYRLHPFAEILKLQFIGVFLGLAGAAFLYLFTQPVAEITILGVNAIVFFWHAMLGDLLSHTHVWVMFPKGVREIFYSPALHLIHHSADAKHSGKNFGFCFAFWDRLAGTLYEPREEEQHNLVFGLEDPEDMRELRSVWQLYWTPIRRIIFGRKDLIAAAPADAAEAP